MPNRLPTAMPIVLYRVDERLIHGQVTVGWGSVLHPRRYVVVDDELAESDWEVELYRLGVPDDARADFLSVEEARDSLDSLRAAPEDTVLLTRSLEVMARLGRGGGLRDREVNVGGLHSAPGRTRVLAYVHLGPADRDAIRELMAGGTQVIARDLPGTARVPGAALLEEADPR